MSFTILLLALAAQAPDSDPITVIGRPSAPFISPMGEPFRARANGEDALTRWFRQADGDGDTRLTPTELLADAERFFASLDADSDGAILPPELVSYEWDIAPEIQVNSRWRRPRGKPRPPLEGYDPRALQGAARYALLNIPQPVAAADSDLDRAVTLDEFRRAAEHRFRLLDRAGTRQLTLVQLQTLLPDPEERHPRDSRNGKRDTRIGTPLPAGD